MWNNRNDNDLPDTGAVVSDRPDMRIVKLGFLAAAFVAGTAGIVYLLPVSDSTKVAFLPLIVVFVVVLVYSIVMYETLAKTVFRVTPEYVEEEGGIVWKRLRRIPLGYVRDVTIDENLIQTKLGTSTITVSATNGDKIVLDNVKDGKEIQEVIWNRVLSRCPTRPQREL
jgi:uncharacterized membrane protein YdbT with pleckstrin-like domain